MEYILLALATALSSGKSIFGKRIGISDKTVGGALKNNLPIFATAILPTFVFALFSGGGGISISPYSILLALIFAASNVTTQITQMQALARGSTSVTTLIYSTGFLIPTLYGHLALGEKISAMQLVGIAILTLALYLIISPKRGTQISLSWIMLSVLSALGSGANAVIQKIHQSSEFKGELYSFLVMSFVFSSLFCFLAHFLFSKERCVSKTPTLRTLTYPMIMGLCVGFLNIVNLTLAGRLPAVIQFPVYNIGGMILTGAVGMILYKEKNTRKQLIGFALGCISILIIGLL